MKKMEQSSWKVNKQWKKWEQFYPSLHLCDLIVGDRNLCCMKEMKEKHKKNEDLIKKNAKNANKNYKSKYQKKSNKIDEVIKNWN